MTSVLDTEKPFEVSYTNHPISGIVMRNELQSSLHCNSVKPHYKHETFKFPSLYAHASASSHSA